MDKKWELIETGLTKFKRIQITPNETEYYRKLEYLSIKMGFEIKDFNQMFAIDNSELRKAFSIYRKNTLAKQKESPKLFNKNWKEETYSAQRQKFHNYLNDLQNKFNELQFLDEVFYFYFYFYFLFFIFYFLFFIFYFYFILFYFILFQIIK